MDQNRVDALGAFIARSAAAQAAGAPVPYEYKLVRLEPKPACCDGRADDSSACCAGSCHYQADQDRAWASIASVAATLPAAPAPTARNTTFGLDDDGKQVLNNAPAPTLPPMYGDEPKSEWLAPAPTEQADSVDQELARISKEIDVQMAGIMDLRESSVDPTTLALANEAVKAVAARQAPTEQAELPEQKDWRKMLTEIGGYENGMIGVPADGVRLMVDEIEALRGALAARQGRTGEPNVTTAWFHQQSSFGPWIECNSSAPGATAFYSGAPVVQALCARQAPDSGKDAGEFIAAELTKSMSANDRPGKWWPMVRVGEQYPTSAVFYCPICHNPMHLNMHTIASDGRVRPSLMCPSTMGLANGLARLGEKCSFHEVVRLDGWTNAIAQEKAQ